MSAPMTQSVIAFLHSVPQFARSSSIRFVVDGQLVGHLTQAMAQNLSQLPTPANCPAIQTSTDTLQLTTGSDVASRSQVLTAYALALRAAGKLQNWRDEPMDLFIGDTCFLSTERAAFRALGLTTRSVHLNGWVSDANGVKLWVAKRSETKFVDPGHLDNLVGGGVASGESLALAITREAWEEAGLTFRHSPRHNNWLHVCRDIREGVQDELIAVHDIWLPAHFQAQNQDGEVASLQLHTIDFVLEQIVASRFTWDAALVILDGLVRQHYFGRDNHIIKQALISLGFRQDTASL